MLHGVDQSLCKGSVYLHVIKHDTRYERQDTRNDLKIALKMVKCESWT